MDYAAFLDGKAVLSGDSGFEPIELPSFLHPHQRHLAGWAIRRGRAAIFADCGLGKTPIQLAWADNVVRHTSRPVLVLTPLAVGGQTVREAAKFGFGDVEQSRTGKFTRKIVVTNYEKLALFRPDDFAGVVCDESSILKNFKGKTKAAITEFMRTITYRLLCTATAAPNDYIELGTSAEALGEMGYQDMLTRFFKLDKGESKNHAWARQMKYRLRPHGERDFWRWVCSWSRACRKPSDLGFDDGPYRLPPLTVNEHVVEARTKRPGTFLDLEAVTLDEQREERRRTLPERCETVARLVDHDRPALVWGHLNDECDMLTRLIPGAMQVSGVDHDEEKEAKLMAFVSGSLRVLVTKPVVFGFGLNLQHCAHETFFPSHSFEQTYQAIARCYRFGQEHEVTVDFVSSEGESGVLENYRRKSKAADAMFSKMVELMNEGLRIDRSSPFTGMAELPGWLPAGVTA